MIPRRLTVLLAAIVPLFVTSCGVSTGRALCNGRLSVADYVLRFGQGLADFGDDETVTLEADSVSVLDVVLDARTAGGETGAAARALADRVAAFVAAMNSHDWVVSDALDDQKATVAADNLGTTEALREANTVEAEILRVCGHVSTLAPPVDTAETLPPPSIASPTQTDPESSSQNDQSEEYALGSAVGSMFGLTLTGEQVQCLGRELQGVVDVTNAQSGPGQYEKQFQAAFDTCGIKYTVGQS